MPMLKFRGIDAQEIKKESKILIDKLTVAIDCPRDYFTLEVIDNKFIFDGEFTAPPTIVEVSWFDRGQEVQDKVAQIITEHFKKDRDCLDVFFNKLNTNEYYENGTHF